MIVEVAVPKKYVEYLDEEISLVKTIYPVVGNVFVVKKPNRKTYISATMLDELRGKRFDKLVVMDSLKPTQIINLVRELRKDVIDRSMLILEIFANHAGSLEAKLQIELAQLRHNLPLIKEAIRYAKIGEMHGFLGAGEYGFEKYYFMLKRRENKVRREIERVRKTRALRRERRERLGYPHVAIIGYTCAGKTTLFNRLTMLSKPVGPEPFTTLTPKSYKVRFNTIEAVVTDTVGFIRDLPPEVLEAFYATLEEVAESDLILNVIDSSKPLKRIIDEVETSMSILGKIGCKGRPLIHVLNKIDLVSSDRLKEIMEGLERALNNSQDSIIPVSAEKNINIDELVLLVESTLKRVLKR